MTIKLMSYVLDGRIGLRPPGTIARAVKAIEEGIDVISAQGTGMDAGPFYLGSERSITSALEPTEVEPILAAAKRTGTPFVFSAGGAGADVHLVQALETVNQVCVETGLRLKIAIISGEIDKEYLKQKVRSGVKARRSMETARLAEYLTEEEIDRSKYIVAQMGPEPIMKCLEEGVDGVITGRALDVGIHMAFLLRAGVSRSQAAHIGKLVECATFVCEPTHSWDFVIAEIASDSFTVRPLNPDLKVTVRAIKTHSLYEREDPNKEKNPGGVLDVTGAVYEQIDPVTVKCRGGVWIDAPYTVKCEGVRSIGYQSSTLFGIRDPNMIDHLEGLEKYVRSSIRTAAGEKEFDLTIHVFGRDGVLGPAEPLRATARPHEVAVLATATAPTQELADWLANGVWIRYFLADFPGRKTTAGNIASPLQQKFASLGEAYAFNIWHLLPLDDPCEPFKRHIIEFPTDVRKLAELFPGGGKAQ